MLVYPHLAHALLQSSEQVGIFLGMAIHDTSQVRLCGLVSCMLSPLDCS